MGASGKGGGTTAQPINAAKQFSQILNLVPKEISQYQGFKASQPNLTMADQLAQFGATQQTPALQALLTGAFGQQTPVGQFKTPLQNALNQYAQIIQSGGALTPDQTRAGTQDVLKTLAAQGMATSPVAPYLTAMNLANLRSQRLAQATGEAQNLTGALRGLDMSNMGAALGFGQGIEALGQQPFANLLAAQQAGTSGYGTFLEIGRAHV